MIEPLTDEEAEELGIEGTLKNFGLEDVRDRILLGRIYNLTSDERVAEVKPREDSLISALQEEPSPYNHFAVLAKKMSHEKVKSLLSEHGFPEPDKATDSMSGRSHFEYTAHSEYMGIQIRHFTLEIVRDPDYLVKGPR